MREERVKKNIKEWGINELSDDRCSKEREREREREREIIERWQVEKSGENKIYNQGKRKNTNKR